MMQGPIEERSFTRVIEAHAAPYIHDHRNLTVHWGASPFPDVISLVSSALGQQAGMQTGLSPQAAEQLALALLDAVRTRQSCLRDNERSYRIKDGYGQDTGEYS